MSDLQQWLSAQRVSHIECLFPDLNGQARGKLIPCHSYLDSAEQRFPQVSLIQTLDGDPQQQLVADSDPDMRLRADPRTLCLKPDSGNGQRIAQLIHDCLDADGEPIPFAPRSVLQRVLTAYRQRGWQPVVAPEIEFYLLAADGQPLSATRQPYSVDQAPAHAAFFAELEQLCAQQHIASDTMLGEVGNGQFEINLQHGDALALADQVFLFKRSAKTLAARHGLLATFMAKPFADDAGSAMHIHQSLVDTHGHNLFSQPDGSAAPRFGHYLGGLQRYLPAAMLLLAANPNAYRRLSPHSAAPINVEWGIDNRSCGLRVPDSTPAARRVENRLPGMDCNPYLAMAATLACGLLGMEQAIAPSAPLSGSAYGMAATLPASLPQAIAALRDEQALHPLLHPQFVASFCALKEVEWQTFARTITPWERQQLLQQA
ncbi:glutamine synthetase family protein [Vogesella indigofera]|uniref:Glutamine synthetase family protein n=1 Tax=Vogesella indigofera TaxID=45465 RepID=A0ABT5I873_VOGIN|nr:glutamine synthetase family protein [Vogesella indigofera]MDC7692360.1 glutamine synthetase family protein [Vogesella indigofera]